MKNDQRQQLGFFSLAGVPVWCVLVLSLLVLCGCGGTSSTKDLAQGPGADPDLLDHGKISGVIIAEANGQPIVGAIVETYQTQATTASDGRYLLGPVPAGDYRVIARSSGYALSVKEDVRVFVGKISENIDFSMTPQTAAHSPDFSVMAIVPFLGGDGDLVTIYCAGCGTERGSVTFNGKDAQIIDWNSQLDDRIQVMAPPEVETGPVRVIINGETSKEVQPQIFIGRPVILEAQPDIAQGGQTITLKGRNFNPAYQYNRVFISEQGCNTIAAPDTETLQVQLPQTAKSGKLSIRIESNEFQLDGLSEVVVTIRPELIHLSPKRSVADVPLTLHGFNFGDDKSRVKVLFGSHLIENTDFLSFSDNKLSFKVPDNTVLALGKRTEVRVQVNNSQSNALEYTAYNRAHRTLPESDYGIHEFSSVSAGGVLRLPTLRPEECIAFLSVLSGDSTQELADDYHYVVSAFLGGNFKQIPTLPLNIRANTRHSLVLPPGQGSSLRGSMTDPASSTIEFFLRDFTAADPWDEANDFIATATLTATGSRCLVYVDIDNDGGVGADDATTIAGWFDGIYNTIATAAWDGSTTPPEGNIDDQPKIVLFMSSTLDNTSFAETLASYIDPRDKNKNELNSAGTEVIYINPSYYFQEPDELRAAMGQSLHRMMYDNQKSIVNVPNSFRGTSWQAAGLSLWVRQLIGYGFPQKNQRAVSYVSEFLNSSGEASLNNWEATAHSTGQMRNQGLNYLFVQYLFDRCGGDDAIKVLHTRHSVEMGLSEIHRVVRLYANPQTNNGLSEFFHDFAKALYCDGIGFPDAFPRYNKDKHSFKTIKLRGAISGIEGLKGDGFNENPVHGRTMLIRGYTCRLVEYSQGNWGDLEVTISGPTAGDFKTWVIYYSTEQTNP